MLLDLTLTFDIQDLVLLRLGVEYPKIGCIKWTLLSVLFPDTVVEVADERLGTPKQRG